MSRDTIDRLWGCRDLDALCGTAARTPTPWPRGGKDRQGATYDRAAVEDLCRLPVGLVDVDPRDVRCTQPWLVREHVAYYLTSRWELGGRTSADQHAEANRFPVIFPDRDGRPIILTGHHRTAAALIQGRPLRARVAAPDDVYFVTPTLLVDVDSDPTEQHRVNGLAAPAGRIVGPSLDAAAETLEQLGVSSTDATIAIAIATRRLPSGAASRRQPPHREGGSQGA